MPPKSKTYAISKKRASDATTTRSVRRKYNSRNTIDRVPKGLTPAVHYFKRGHAFNIDLRDQSGVSGLTLTSDGGVVWAVQAQLSDLPDHVEFTSLFDQYRITGMKLTFYPSRTQALGSIETNILLRTSKMPTGLGVGAASTQAEWLQRQAVTIILFYCVPVS